MSRNIDDAQQADRPKDSNASQKGPFREAFNDLVERKSDVTRDTIPPPPPSVMPPEIAAGDGFTGKGREALQVRWHSLAVAIERSKCYYELRKQWSQRWSLVVPGFFLIAGSMAGTPVLDPAGTTSLSKALAL